jgi:hypothetical protein
MFRQRQLTVAFKHVAAGGFAVAAAVALALAVSASAQQSPARQTIVLDVTFGQTVVDKPPKGPSVGDVEHDDGQVRDAAGRPIGALHLTCVFTKILATDALERCTGTAATTDGTVRLAGVGHLNPPNPPWEVTGLTGRYAGLHGRLSFSLNIPLSETAPGLIPAGPYDSVDVVELGAARHLRAAVVARPAANVPFIARANSLCNATQAAGSKLPPFPFSNFDPLRPNPARLPQVGHFLDQPERRRLAPEL